jgi:hypothetical protein
MVRLGVSYHAISSHITSYVRLFPHRMCCHWLSAVLPAQHVKTPKQAQEDTSPAKIDVTSQESYHIIQHHIISFYIISYHVEIYQRMLLVCISKQKLFLYDKKKSTMRSTTILVM